MNLGTILASIGIGLGVLLLFLAGFIALKTMLYSPPQKKADKVDFVKVDGKNVAERLGLAVQCKTVSYHEAEKVDTSAFLALHRLFQTLYPQVHSKLTRELVNDYSLLYTWEGKDPSLKPIMLTSHLDVVPADESKAGGWTHPPFAGEVVDGYVWGRGTLDIKSGVIGILEAVEYLLKQGFQPERTVYLGFGHDEEIGGEHGAQAIAELLDSRGVKLGSLLDEGGSVIEGFLPGVERQVGVIGISEKGYVSLKLSVEMEGGHSSMPAQETAIGVLSRAVASLELNPMPPHLEVIEFLMSYLGSALPFKQRLLFANTWLFGGILKKELAKANMLNATIRTTTAPTIFNAGMKDNVLPAKAEAVVNFRILPGDDLRSVYEMVLERISDERVKVTPYLGDTLEGESGWDPSPVANTDSPYYLRLARLTKEAFPDALVAPYLVLGGTDARHYGRLTRNALRFTPILMSKEDVGSVHGVNEKLSIDECSRMVGFYIAYIEELSNLSGELDIEPEPEPELETIEEDLIEVNPVEEPYAELGKEELDALDEEQEEE
ncbi:MAG: M20/M25/M40 family metallo-hydrolase [Anaerolineaceae bacterium]|nr:M20/M25/M40 family metallo-hydrolase [Anaerolineaceae bacterium]